MKNIYYICRDYQGSITHITNSSGSVVHTGHEHLGHYNLQLINMNARLYDPALGRFLSPDPYVQAPDFSQSFNRYSYCLNNPLKYTDADGEFWHIIIGAIVGGVVNLTSNWDNINGFWQGVTSFVVGAGAGAAVAATGGAGAGLWATAGVAASGGAVSAGTNSVIAQTGENFSGFNKVNWGQVGVGATIGGVAGFAGSAAGYWASNASFLVNGVSSPVLRSAVVSPLAAGAGHVAGGTTANFLAGQSLDMAFSNSFKGIGKNMALGGALGVATTIGVSYANKVSPWNGKSITSKTETKGISQFSGSTIDEAVELVMNDPNKLNHIFSDKHNLDPLATSLGGKENTIRAVLNAANGNLPANGIYDIPVNVNGQTVFIRGNVMGGIPRIGTMYIP